jgi:hypothetical protein
MSNPNKQKSRRSTRVAAFTTATIVSFSFTLLAAGIGVLTGLVPLHTLSFGQRVDVGSLLFLMPVVALVLGVCVEVTRIAIRRQDLPDSSRAQPIQWQPGRREG